MKFRPIEKTPIKKIRGAVTPQSDSYYQAWQRPFYGKSKDDSLKAGVNMAKGIGIFFAVKF